MQIKNDFTTVTQTSCFCSLYHKSSPNYTSCLTAQRDTTTMDHTVPGLKTRHIKTKACLVSMVKFWGPVRDGKRVRKDCWRRSFCSWVRPACLQSSQHSSGHWLATLVSATGSVLRGHRAQTHTLTHTLAHTETAPLWPYSWHNDDQPVSAFSALSPVLFGPVQDSGFSRRSKATRATTDVRYCTSVLSCSSHRDESRFKWSQWDYDQSFVIQFTN